MADKQFSIKNTTGYTLSNLLLYHANTITAGKGWLVVEHKGWLLNGHETEKGTTGITVGLDDDWYLICNILVHQDKWPYKDINHRVIDDGCVPVALTNSKGWKQCNIEPGDSGAVIELSMNEISSWTDIKLNSIIKPSESRSCDHWLEVAGHGGQGPTFALTYPGIAVGASFLGLGAYLTISGMEATAALATEEEYAIVLAIMASLPAA